MGGLTMPLLRTAGTLYNTLLKYRTCVFLTAPSSLGRRKKSHVEQGSDAFYFGDLESGPEATDMAAATSTTTTITAAQSIPCAMISCV